MKIETELNPGEHGFFLENNEVLHEKVCHVKVEAREGGSLVITYTLSLKGGLTVPEKRAAKTKAELLAKL